MSDNRLVKSENQEHAGWIVGACIVAGLVIIALSVFLGGCQ